MNQLLRAVMVLILFCPLLAHGQVTRLLIVGDSWAEEQWQDGSHVRVLSANGLAGVGVSGELTTTSGSTAADWVMPANLGRIAQALDQYPHIDTVQLTVGGNDFLDFWNTGFTPDQFQQLIDFIRNDVEIISNYILNQRPEIEIIVSLYDYPNFEDTRDGLIWTFACSPLWNNLGQPNPLQLNTAAVEVIDAIEAYVDQNTRISHVRHLGRAQNFIGLPGQPPGTIPPPGVINLPSPVTAMRTRFFGGGRDCFHFNATAYDVLIGNLLDGYLEDRFDSGLDLEFGSLTATYNGAPQGVTVLAVPPDQPLLVSYNGSLEVPINAGSYAVTVTAPGWRENFSSVFEIAPGSQSIELDLPASVFNFIEEIEVVVSASSGLPVNLELVSGPAVLNGQTLNLTGELGTIVLEATQSGDNNWLPAEFVTRSIEVIELVDELFEDRFESID